MNKPILTAILLIVFFCCNSCRRDTVAQAHTSLLTVTMLKGNTATASYAYDRLGRIREMKEKNEKFLYEYKDRMVVIRQFTDEKSEPLAIYRGRLDEKGCLAWLEGTRQYGNDPLAYRFSYRFDYDEQKQLRRLYYIRDNGKSRSSINHTYFWNNGNMVREVITHDGVLSRVRTYKYDLSRENKMAVAVKTTLDWIDRLPGKATNNLPLGYTDKDAGGEVIWQTATSWQLDRQGYPATLTTTNLLSGQADRVHYEFR
ncbi:MAG TPA: hypothetical protein VFR58_15950 [Flavisolibacter sp.]|nr:hypothetical protein [Flavisolibacter sp.]